MTTPTIDATAAPCPPWCGWEKCDHDYHLSRPTYTPVTGRGEKLDVSLVLDEVDMPDTVTVGVTVSAIGPSTATADLTPAQTLAFIETLRQHALTAAGPDGMEMPVEQVRIGDQIKIGDRWETVELVTLDGWCCGQPAVPGHAHRVQVGTNATPDDNDTHDFDMGDVVTVRQAVAE